MSIAGNWSTNMPNPSPPPAPPGYPQPSHPPQAYPPQQPRPSYPVQFPPPQHPAPTQHTPPYGMRPTTAHVPPYSVPQSHVGPAAAVPPPLYTPAVGPVASPSPLSPGLNGSYVAAGTPAYTGAAIPPPYYYTQFPKVEDHVRNEKKATILRRYRQMRVEVCETLNIQVPMTKFGTKESGHGECREFFDEFVDMLRYHTLVHQPPTPLQDEHDLICLLKDLNDGTYTHYKAYVKRGAVTELIEEYPTYDVMIDDLHESVEDRVRTVHRIVESYRSTALTR